MKQGTGSRHDPDADLLVEYLQQQPTVTVLQVLEKILVGSLCEGDAVLGRPVAGHGLALLQLLCRAHVRQLLDEQLELGVAEEGGEVSLVEAHSEGPGTVHQQPERLL